MQISLDQKTFKPHLVIWKNEHNIDLKIKCEDNSCVVKKASKIVLRGQYVWEAMDTFFQVIKRIIKN